MSVYTDRRRATQRARHLAARRHAPYVTERVPGGWIVTRAGA